MGPGLTAVLHSVTCCGLTGGCDVDLTCEAAQCVPASAGTTAGTSSAGTLTSVTDSETASETAVDTLGGAECDLEDGRPCRMCARLYCCDAWEGCIADPDGCLALFQCGAVDGTPYPQCEMPDGAGAGVAFNTLAQCLLLPDTPDECELCLPPVMQCLPAPPAEIIYRECTSCAAQNCCDALIECRADASCSCWEDCLAKQPGEGCACPVPAPDQEKLLMTLSMCAADNGCTQTTADGPAQPCY